MTYYYLKDNDIVRQGDELRLDNFCRWVPCYSTIGKTFKNISIGIPNLQVRRPIKKTKLGNII